MSKNPPAYIKGFVNGIAPDQYMYIDEWADKYRVLPKGASAEAGKYSTERMPYLKGLMRAMSPQSRYQQAKAIKGTQLGFSEAGINMSLYYMDIVPTSQLTILPTETLAKSFSTKKLTPSLRAMKHLAKKIKQGKTKDDIGETFDKEYPGGSNKIVWSFSPANYRSLSCRFVNMDDVDGFPLEIGEEGSPLDLGKKRADGFGLLKKIYINSTPTTEGESNIEVEFEDSDQRHYYMPCPECTPKDNLLQNKDNMVLFEKEHFIFDYNKETYELIGDVHFSCPHCGSLIPEYKKTWMMAEKNGAKEIAHNEGHIHYGIRVPSYYSPIGFLSWNDIFREFLEAKKEMNRGSVRKMKTWVNTRDAKVWKEEVESVNVDNLADRKETYKSEVPEGVLVLAAGVDTQNDRFEVEVVGYGKNGETWSIDYQIIQGDPNTPEARDALAAYLNKTFLCHDGSRMKIYSKGVDTGGHRTKAAYKFCKPRYKQRVYALKGASSATAPFINKRASKNNSEKINLFLIGVNAGKDEIYANLEIDEPGPNYMHFPDKPEYTDEYFKQLTAEKRNKRTGIWENKRKRNEAVDCRNYSNASLQLAGIDDEILNLGKRFGIVSIQTQSTQKRAGRRRIISRGRG